MKKTILLLVMLFLTFFQVFSQNISCDFKSEPKLVRNETKEAHFEAWLQTKIEEKKLQLDINQLITIPVVVHVIHKGEPVGFGSNVGDAQIVSQFVALNNDMRRAQGSLGYNTSLVGADIEIEFVLAKVDPNGNPFNGIDRINLCYAEPWTAETIDLILKPQTIWNPDQYLNIWVADTTTSGILGYGTFPVASGIEGLFEGFGSSTTDGIVINYNTFGSNLYSDGSFLLNPPYEYGRILTHEVGHFLGLRHIWGDYFPCFTDYCADTPPHNGINVGCPTGLSCDNSAPLMTENYMDYTSDNCKNIFTQDQKNRMRAVMDNADRRALLKVSDKHLPIPLFANDGEIKIEKTCTQAISSCSTPNQPLIQKITLHNRGINTINSASISYSVNENLPVNYNWNGTILPNKSVTFDMPIISQTSGQNTVVLTSINGVTDTRSSNNIAIGAFVKPVTLENYNFTDLLLVIDNTGFFQNWTIKNGNNEIVVQGNYGSAPQSSYYLNLPSNQCYEFTIQDVYPNPPTPTYSYKISSYDELTIIHNVQQFLENDPRYFTIGIENLNNSEVKNPESINIYPNPVDNELNVVSENKIDTYEIYNSLGQKISFQNEVNEKEFNIDTRNFSDGIYFLKMVTEDKTKTIRFIKK